MASWGLPLEGCPDVWHGSDASPEVSGVVCVLTSPVALGTIPVPSTLVPLVQALFVIGMSVPEPSSMGGWHMPSALTNSL